MPKAKLYILVLLATTAPIGCADERPLAPGPLAKPLFNHALPALQSVAINVNDYVVELDPVVLFNGFFRGDQVLFDGGLAYGTGPQSVFLFNPANGNNDLSAGGLPIEVSSPGALADHQTVSLAVELPNAALGPKMPLGMVVVRETFAYAGASYIIVKYTLVNATPQLIAGLHVGQILDNDLGDVFDNFVQSVPAEQLAQVTAPSTPRTTGQIVLTDAVTGYRGWSVASPDPGTNSLWFDFLSGGIVDGTAFGPGDIRDLLSVGPLDIAAGGSRVVAFALVSGEDAIDLSSTVAAARGKWLSVPALGTPFPVTIPDVRIEPRTILIPSSGLFQATLTFSSAAVASRFDASQAFCGGAPAVTAAPPEGAQVTATFRRSDLDRRLRAGSKVFCAGKLTDGAFYAGSDTPALLALVTTVAHVTRLTFDPAEDLAPTWSPDGTSIAFSSSRGGTLAIWRMNLKQGEASAVQLTGEHADRAPDWFGNTIAFGRADENAIYSIPAAGGDATLLTADGVNPRYSPTGASIAFTRGGHIWTMSAGGEAVQPAVQVSFDGFEFQPEWGLPSGNEIYFTVLGSGIFKVVASGGPETRVTPDEGTDNRHAALSPDGKLLAFVSSTPGVGFEIVLQNLATGNHTVVNLDPPASGLAFFGAERNQNLEFSPDGGKLLFSAGGDIFVADVSQVARLASR